MIQFFTNSIASKLFWRTRLQAATQQKQDNIIIFVPCLNCAWKQVNPLDVAINTG